MPDTFIYSYNLRSISLQELFQDVERMVVFNITLIHSKKGCIDDSIEEKRILSKMNL